jgi:hypothetical protein
MTDGNESQQDIITPIPVMVFPRDVNITNIVFTTSQVADILDISEATLRGWISRKQFPHRDTEINAKSPLWRIQTITEYLRNAPGGRLPYQVG